MMEQTYSIDSYASRFEDAVREYTVNVSQHMVKIKEELGTAEESESEDTVVRKEELLDELLEIVESIDHAKGESSQHQTTMQYLLIYLEDKMKPTYNWYLLQQ